jgi:DNA repair photolyase
LALILKPFDPWKNDLCTCPPKLSLNPYTGCSHGCLYCYATSYIPRFWECRPKAGLLEALRREARRVEHGCLICASNSSDPYPPMEKELYLTRGCLKVLKEWDNRVQVITKSDLVARDIDLLSRMRSAVSMTVTTLSSKLASKLEPGAPEPEKRLLCMETLSENGVPVSARLDPLIPSINEPDLEETIRAIALSGARHITASTYKARPDNLSRICNAFPEEGAFIKDLLKKGEHKGGTARLPEEVRREILQRAKRSCQREGLTFSACREGFDQDATSCDGSHLTLAGKGCDGSKWRRKDFSHSK